MKKVLLSLMMLFCTAGLFAQKSADDMLIEQAVNQLVGKRTFTFIANRILSSGGSQSILNQLNSMVINKDTLRVKLPYFGKGFSSSDMSSGNPLQFVSTDFTYDVEVSKKGDKIITMDVKSPIGTDRFTFTLTISQGIMAKLMINGTTRTSMSFSGYIQENGAVTEQQDK